MDLQAAIGMHQILRVDEYWKRRKAIWDAYTEAFDDLPLGLPALWRRTAGTPFISSPCWSNRTPASRATNC
jgi:dTDP-4-amino-4,6-dideoxygalactose transaminase